MREEVYKKVLDINGVPVIDPITNDFVMELVEVITTADGILPIDWKNFKEDLFKSALFYRAIQDANPNAYATLLKVISDGEAGITLESNFQLVFNLLGLVLTTEETIFLNTTLANNHFTISF